MKIEIVSCSGPNENNSPEEIVKFLQDYPIAEASIQACNKEAPKGSLRYDWIKEFAKAVQKSEKSLRASIHFNRQWVQDFINGKSVAEIEEYLDLEDGKGGKLFKRVQLNFLVGRDELPNAATIIKNISKYNDRRFIMSYNPANEKIIKEIYELGFRFDNLFDTSFGRGVFTGEVQAPIFPDDVLQGYAGGLGPENIKEYLNKLDKLVKPETKIFIDAHGKLGFNKDHFDVEKGRAFAQAALDWQARA